MNSQPQIQSEHTKEIQELTGGASAQLTAEVSRLLAADATADALELLVGHHPTDQALVVQHLPLERAKQLCSALPDEAAAVLLPALSAELRELLLAQVEPERLRALLDHLPAKQAAEVLAALPQASIRRILPLLAQSGDIGQLLLYPEESAGRIMSTDHVSVPSTATKDVSRQVVHKAVDRGQRVPVVYLVDSADRLQGIVTLESLLLANPQQLMGELAAGQTHSVHADQDQEEVGRLMERYTLQVVPVIDGQGRLLGQITASEALTVLRQEASEDLQLISGNSGDETPSDSVFRVSRGRLPWLLAGLIGAGLSGMIIRGFDEALQRAVVLATFIPVVMSMAGSVGIQSSALVLQGISTGEIWATDLWRRLLKEVTVAVINGLTLGMVLSGATYLLPLGQIDRYVLSYTAGLALILVVLLAAIVGTTVPLLLHRLRLDPALAAGPFITTSNDILSLVVFFLIATFLYL